MQLIQLLSGSGCTGRGCSIVFLFLFENAELLVSPTAIGSTRNPLALERLHLVHRRRKTHERSKTLTRMGRHTEIMQRMHTIILDFN